MSMLSSPMMMGLTGLVLATSLTLSIWAFVRTYEDKKKGVVTTPQTRFLEGVQRPLIFAPFGETGSKDTFTTWPALMAELATIAGEKTIIFDNRGDFSDQITIPAGTYDMTDVKWTMSPSSRAVFNPALDATITATTGVTRRLEVILARGCVFKNLHHISGPFLIRCNNSVAANITITNPSGNDINATTVRIEGGAMIAAAAVNATSGTTKPFISFQNVTRGALILDTIDLIKNGHVDNVPLIELTGTSTVDVHTNNSMIGENEFTCASTCTLRFFITGALVSHPTFATLNYPVTRIVNGRLNAVGTATVTATDMNSGSKFVNLSSTAVNAFTVADATAAGTALTTLNGFKLGDVIRTVANTVVRANAVASATTFTWA